MPEHNRTEPAPANPTLTAAVVVVGAFLTLGAAYAIIGGARAWASGERLARGVRRVMRTAG